MKSLQTIVAKWFALLILAGSILHVNAQQFIGMRSHTGNSVSFDLVTFNADSPETVEVLRPSAVSVGSDAVASAFSQGYFYVISRLPNTNTSGLWGFSTLSANENWAEISTETIALAPGLELPVGLIFNYATNELFLAVQDLSGAAGAIFRTRFYTINVETREMTFIESVNEFFQVVACCPNGIWYGITANTGLGTPAGTFMSIDLTNGTATQISATGIIPNFSQSMVFDRPSGRLFWARATGTNRNTSTVRLQEINVADGTVTSLGDIQNRSYILGLSSAIIATNFAPFDGEIDVPNTATPAVTFNNTITASDLSKIQIYPAVTGFLPSISNNVLTLAHDPLVYGTIYTITVPKEAIQYLEYDVSWSFEVMPNPIECNPPSQLEVSDIMALSAVLSWHETGQATVWNVKYGPTGFDVETEGTLISNITENPFVLQNLNELTAYDFYVQAICGSELSDWSPVQTFTTPKDCSMPISTFPWTENFENLVFPSYCWQNVDVDEDIEPFTGEPNQWQRIRGGEEVAIHSQSGDFHVVHNFSLHQDTGWLVTPKIAIPSDGAYILRFWSFNEHSNSFGPIGSRPDPLSFGYNGVWISTGSSDIASGDFVEVWTPWHTSDVRDEWMEDKINLSDHFAGQEIYIAFVYKGRAGHRWHLDNLTVEAYDYKDIRIRSIDRPSGGGPNLSGNVAVTLFNNGSAPLTNVPAILRINGEDVAREIIAGPIFSLVHFQYTFDHQADFSEVGTYRIEVEIELEGDLHPNNNKMTHSIFATCPENITLFGFSTWSFPAPDNRFVSFNTTTFNTPITALGEFTIGQNTTVAGEYLNGYFYMFSQRSDHDIGGYFVKIDTETWTEVSRVPVSETAREMAFDYPTQTMFASRQISTTETALFTVNLTTGALTQVATIHASVLGLAIHLDGTLYAVLTTGDFVKIDRNTGDFTVINNTGFVYGQFVQSMAFDHNTGRLFWALAGDGPQSGFLYGGLVEIDVATGVPHYYGRIGQIHTILVGLHTPFTNPFASIGTQIVAETGNIMLYPNPVNAGNALSILLPENVFEANVRIYDIVGRLVHQQTVEQTLTAPTQPGLYVVQIHLPNGTTSVQRLVVK